MQFQGRKLRRWRRARTTALNDFVAKDLKEATIGTKARLYSPTRSADPQPVGLVFQKPLASHAYAIWNPEPSRRKTQSRFPLLAAHMKLTNFSCGEPLKECPWDREVKPPQIHYSLESTSRSSYRHPSVHPEWIRPPKSLKKGISEEYAAQGIVPNILPRINNKPNNGYSNFLENLKSSGPSGLRALGECSAKTMGKSIVQQLIEK